MYNVQNKGECLLPIADCSLLIEKDEGTKGIIKAKGRKVRGYRWQVIGEGEVARAYILLR